MENNGNGSLKDEGIACLWEYAAALQDELRRARKQPTKALFRYLGYKLFQLLVHLDRLMPASAFIKIASLAGRYRPDSEWTAEPIPAFVSARALLGHPDKCLYNKALQREISTPDLNAFPDLSALRNFVPSGRIAVFVHVYYPEMWDELETDLENIPEQFDLFVSLVDGKSNNIEGDIKSAFPNAVVRIFPNHGRDIYPFVSFVNTGIAAKYDLILKVHSKLAPHLDDGGSAWRRSFIDPLLASKWRVKGIIAGFERDPKLGLLAANGHMSGKWGVCLATVAALAQRVAVPLRPGKLQFATGSIFWMRGKALEKLAALKLTATDFEPEANQIDGCMHHAVERFLGVATQAAGFSVRETGALFTRFPELYDPPSVQAAAHILVRKPQEITGRQICLFVTYTANGEHWPHVLELCRGIRSEGFVTIMIVATDKLTLDVVDPGPEICDGIIVKQNGGFDFAAWALALRLLPELWASRLILFVNDSIYGPLCGFSQTCSRIRTSSSDYIGLTKSSELKPHFQSYFFALKGRALTAPSIEGFWSSVRMLDYKKDVIDRYELQLLEYAKKSGLRTQALFDLDIKNRVNPTHYYWKELIRKLDFPFIKVELLRDNPKHQDLSGWESLLREKKYDPQLILHHLKAAKPHAPAILALSNTSSGLCH